MIIYTGLSFTLHTFVSKFAYYKNEKKYLIQIFCRNFSLDRDRDRERDF